MSTRLSRRTILKATVATALSTPLVASPVLATPASDRPHSSPSLADAEWAPLTAGIAAGISAEAPPDGTPPDQVGMVALMQRARLVAGDAVPYGSFGHAMAVSADGTTAIVGAPRIEGAMRGVSQIQATSTDTGAAYLFTRTGSLWTQQQVLIPVESTPGDSFGYAVALSADGATAIIGAPAIIVFDEGKNPASNAAYVFTRSGATWTQRQKLTASDLADGDDYGYAVAVSADGTTAAIGAAGKDGVTGAVYVFARGGDRWTQQQGLVAADATGGDGFGYPLGLSGNGETVVIGAAGKNAKTGAAYIFTRDGTVWSQQQEVVASDAVRGALFGSVVAVSGDGATALIGASGHQIGNTIPGAAYVFTREGDRWTQQAQLLLNGGSDRFGYAVALSGTGETAVIGEPGVIMPTAFMFARAGTSWSQQQPLSYNGPGHVSLAFYASAVAMSADGTTVLIGAQTEGDQGAIYVFGP